MNQVVKKWIHLTELGGDQWILPIWSAVNEAIKRGVVEEIPPELKESGVYISTRLNFLPRIISLINADAIKLYEALQAHKPEHEFNEGNKEKAKAFDIDNDLKYSLLISIDSLLFELNSVCELKMKLFEKLHVLADKPMPHKNAGLAIKKLLEGKEHDASWFGELDEHRNFFSHNGTPYLAVDITSGMDEVDILVMRENLKEFSDPKKFLRMSKINNIVQGFEKSKPIIQEYLKGLFED